MIGIHRLSLAVACLAAAPAAAHACVLGAFAPWHDGAHLIATATADTVPAGDGGIFGQVMQMERVGGPGAEGAGAQAGRVVLVPWAYDEDCRRQRWTERARWVQPGERGLFLASLRPREGWVQGVPTFDVADPYQFPYPQRVRDDWLANRRLTVEQAFELVGVLPRFSEYRENRPAALRPLLEWARANPRLAGRYPASEMVGDAIREARRAQLGPIDPPLAGTYRFTVSVDGGAPRTFHARTGSTPVQGWNPAVRSNAELLPPLDAPLAGYTLRFAGAPTEDALPASYEAGYDPARDGFISVVAVPETGADGVQLWRGRMLDLAVSQFPGDDALMDAVTASLERLMRRLGAGELQDLDTRFLLRPDGSVTMEHRNVLPDGRVVVVQGERISRVSIPGEPPEW